MTPAGTSNELDVQNGWEENTHTHPMVSSCTVQYKDEVDGRELLVVYSFIILDRRAARQILY